MPPNSRRSLHLWRLFRKTVSLYPRELWSFLRPRWKKLWNNLLFMSPCLSDVSFQSGSLNLMMSLLLLLLLHMHYFVLFQTTLWMATTLFLIVKAMSALNSFAGRSVESLAHFLRLKGFPEEIVECLLGMVVAFFWLCRKKGCLLCQIRIGKKNEKKPCPLFSPNSKVPKVTDLFRILDWW